ncbi:apolipoprotein N-acyltransferase [Leucobacter chinensis]|uniref:apolipoprotein N-acyltransferase n=1 Tax=Leucobacter chinensis TaxID=2851010 RepID=UPI001C22E1A6
MTEKPTLRRVPLIFAAPLAALGGLLVMLAYPGQSLWISAFAGVLAILTALWNQKGRHGLWLGLIAGAALWLPLIDWLTLYLGLIPWAALSGAMVLWFVLMGGAISRVTSSLSQRGFSVLITVTLQVVSVAGLWVAREGVQSTFPYGGFAWGRLAHTQAEGPLLSLVSYLGFAGLTGLIVMLMAVPVAVFFAKPRVFHAPVSLVAVAATIGVASFVPLAALEVTDTARIVGIQGNSRSGVFDDRENGDVIADHIRETQRWLDGSNEPVDAVVWPENSAEYGLIDNPRNLQRVRALARLADAPIVTGTILGEGPEGERTYTNSSLVVEPDSRAMPRFDKRHPVPFAEYMPNRAFYHAIVPDLVDMVQLEYQHGATETVLPVGQLQAGIAICFDIVFDDMARMMVGEGAQVIFAQTNNADFGTTDQSEQQVFIARLRAVETGRAIVNISTVATSEIIAPDGSVLASVEPWQPGAMEAEVPLVTGTTPAVRFGTPIAGLLIALGMLSLACTLVRLKNSK